MSHVNKPIATRPDFLFTHIYAERALPVRPGLRRAAETYRDVPLAVVPSTGLPAEEFSADREGNAGTTVDRGPAHAGWIADRIRGFL